jgi:hypothetical protein
MTASADRVPASGEPATTSDELVPAWLRVTLGEPRLPVTLAVLATIAMQFLIPNRIATRPHWAVAGIALVLLVGIIAANPKRIDRPSKALRVASLLLIALLSTANVASAARLVIDLTNGQGIRNGSELLFVGGVIWMTNVILFALFYWEFDRGGPVARSFGTHTRPDLLFPQFQLEGPLRDPEWEPNFIGYLYVSFTNATAFSPTDTLPLSRWAKMTMMLQSAVSLITVILVISRAVSIFK